MKALLSVLLALAVPVCAAAQAGDNSADPAQQLSPDKAVKSMKVPELGDLPIAGDLFQVQNAPLSVEAAPDVLTWVTGPAGDKRVDVELDNATPEQALRQICDRAGVKYEAGKDLPRDPRITLHARSVPFRTALELVTQNAGLRWSVQRRGNDWIYRVGTNADNLFALPQNTLKVFQTPNEDSKFFGNNKPYVLTLPRDSNAYSSVLADPSSAKLFTYRTTEERATFTCPHCHGQVTMIRTRQQPKCPRCGRTFQSDWEFCPYDGAKRPASTSAWHYCPLCGKQVDEEAVH